MNITISTHLTAIDAHIIRGRLESEGIPAFVAFEHHVWANWSISNAIGGVQVQIPQLFISKAQEVISNINNGVYFEELKKEVSFSPEISCPECSSMLVKNIRLPLNLSLIFLFILMFPVSYTQHKYKCNSCSYAWVAKEQRAYPIYIPILCVAFITSTLFIFLTIWNQWCKINCEHPFLYVF